MRAAGENRVWWRVVTALLTVVVLAAAAVVLVRAHDAGDLNGLLCDGDCGPQYVAAPDELEPVVAAGASARTGSAGAVDPAAVQAAVSGALTQPELGPSVGLSVRQLDGVEVFGSGGALTPASTTKVLTGLAALTVIDPQRRFSTEVRIEGDRLSLVGGGDPYLRTEPAERPHAAEHATLSDLADHTVAALQREGVGTVTVSPDASLFTGPAGSAAWEPSYLSQDIVSPISALWVERGVHDGRRDDDPALVAAQRFTDLLNQRGVVATLVGAAEATGQSRLLASVESATLAQIVEHVEQVSDNEAAEVLARHVAIAASEPASFDGGAAAVTAVAERLGLVTEGLELHDGSGLSRANRISPSTLTDAVVHAPGLWTDLPVAGFSGTLADRFGAAVAGLGLVRAKTGTLTGVHSLAGTVVTADGTTVAFAVMVDQTAEINGFATQAALDRVAAALAGCQCARR